MAKLEIKVIPGASKNRCIKKEDTIVVYITERPEKGKANRAILRFLKKKTGVPVSIVKGETVRKKVIEFPLEQNEFLEKILQE